MYHHGSTANEMITANPLLLTEHAPEVNSPPLKIVYLWKIFSDFQIGKHPEEKRLRRLYRWGIKLVSVHTAPGVLFVSENAGPNFYKFLNP